MRLSTSARTWSPTPSLDVRKGEHAGWLIVDLDTRAEALQMIPPQLRAGARIVQLKKWTRAEIEAMMKELEA